MKKFQVNLIDETLLESNGFRHAAGKSWWRFTKQQVGDITLVFAVNIDLGTHVGIITAYDKANPRGTPKLGKLILSYIDSTISSIEDDLKESGIAGE